MIHVSRLEIVSTEARAKRGTTLIELTVSVASVGLLLSMLVPALSEARREGKEVRCLSNLGQIADASAIYAASDAQEFLVPAHAGVSEEESTGGVMEWGGKSGMGDPIDGGFLDSRWGTTNGRGPATRPLNRIVYGEVFPDYRDDRGPQNVNWIRDTELELRAFHCPSDYGYTAHHYLSWRDSKLTSYDHYGNSYSAVSMFVGFPGETLLTLSSLMRPVSRIPAPARTLMYLENSGRFAWRRNYGIDNCSAGEIPQDPIRGWHGRQFMFNVAFSDGHAAATFIDGHQHPQPDIGRYPLFGGQPTSYLFWHCLIIRGADWQMDTLPGGAGTHRGSELIQEPSRVAPELGRRGGSLSRCCDA